MGPGRGSKWWLLVHFSAQTGREGRESWCKFFSSLCFVPSVIPAHCIVPSSFVNGPSQAFPMVCLLGDSESSQTDKEDDPSRVHMQKKFPKQLLLLRE